MSSETIFLEPGKVYDLGGKKYTLKELRDHAIDSMMYRKHLEELNKQ